MNMKVCLSILMLLLIKLSAFAQRDKKSEKALLKNYRDNAIWVDMMKDPTVNYHEAVLAFEEFWRGKPEPEEIMRGEEEGEHGEDERSFLSRIFKSEKKEREELMKYAEDYKRFRYWQRKYEAYVKSDGTVMSDDEIQALINQELQNRNK